VSIAACTSAPVTPILPASTDIMWLILSIFCDVPGQEPPNTVIKFIAANFCLCVREEYTLEELEVLVDGVKFALVDKDVCPFEHKD
jgi:hypothetical protein